MHTPTILLLISNVNFGPRRYIFILIFYLINLIVKILRIRPFSLHRTSNQQDHLHQDHLNRRIKNRCPVPILKYDIISTHNK